MTIDRERKSEVSQTKKKRRSAASRDQEHIRLRGERKFDPQAGVGLRHGKKQKKERFG